MAIAAVVQMALVGRRAYESRQNSVLGLAKIDHTVDEDNDDSAVVDTVPAAPSAATATTTNRPETVEHVYRPCYIVLSISLFVSMTVHSGTCTSPGLASAH
eukprot:10567-Heterococcus_DN1.PRE.3